MSFLDEIRPKIEDQVERRKAEHPPAELKKNLSTADHAFSDAIRSTEYTSLIAEFKRRSPSQGGINEEASLESYASLYDQYADALSILTEPEYFGGEPSLLTAASSYTNRPLLRKDFIIDSYQILEARHVGADAVLLIEHMLSDRQLRSYIEQVEDLGMDALVECHDREGLERVLDAGAEVIGINNRDLESLEVDLNNMTRLMGHLSDTERADHLFVAESGLYTRSDVLSVEEVADAVLIGTAIMSASVPEVKLKELTGQTLVKFCGITTVADARRAVDAGADLIGLNFYEPSPRSITVDRAREIAEAVRGEVMIAGVFVNADFEEVKRVVEHVGLDYIQCSGEESLEEVQELQTIGPPVLDAVHVKDRDTVENVHASPAQYQMVDAFTEDQYGGTGKRIDDELVHQSDVDERELVVAGGLTPENVGEIQKRLRPLMLDVCSGIEAKPGTKDPEAMNAFIQAVRQGTETTGES